MSSLLSRMEELTRVQVELATGQGELEDTNSNLVDLLGGNATGRRNLTEAFLQIFSQEHIFRLYSAIEEDGAQTLSGFLTANLLKIFEEEVPHSISKLGHKSASEWKRKQPYDRLWAGYGENDDVQALTFWKDHISHLLVPARSSAMRYWDGGYDHLKETHQIGNHSYFLVLREKRTGEVSLWKRSGESTYISKQDTTDYKLVAIYDYRKRTMHEGERNKGPAYVTWENNDRADTDQMIETGTTRDSDFWRFYNALEHVTDAAIRKVNQTLGGVQEDISALLPQLEGYGRQNRLIMSELAYLALVQNAHPELFGSTNSMDRITAPSDV